VVTHGGSRRPVFSSMMKRLSSTALGKRAPRRRAGAAVQS
jgi:hypothetical protein